MSDRKYDVERKTFTDRFGNPYKVIKAINPLDKKTGQRISTHFRGLVDLAGKVYQVTVYNVSDVETKKGETIPSMGVEIKLLGTKGKRVERSM